MSITVEFILCTKERQSDSKITFFMEVIFQEAFLHGGDYVGVLEYLEAEKWFNI
jgi:hypothetical protein